MCLGQWNLWREVFQLQQSREAGGPGCQRSHEAPMLARGRVGAEIQFPATNEPGALAWRDLVWVALGTLWGEEVGERAAGSGHPSYLHPLPGGQCGSSPHHL